MKKSDEDFLKESIDESFKKLEDCLEYESVKLDREIKELNLKMEYTKGMFHGFLLGGGIISLCFLLTLWVVYW